MAIISSRKQAPEPDRLDSAQLGHLPLTVQASYGGKPPRTPPLVGVLQPEPDDRDDNARKELLKAESEPEEHGKPEERLRPQKLSDYVGQKDLKDVLDIAIQAAKVRKEPLDHLLLYGPPGLGKTTMSLILAAEMGVNCKITSAPSLERPRDIMGLLVTLQPGDVLFIDEIHRLPRITEELLYPAMEDFRGRCDWWQRAQCSHSVDQAGSVYSSGGNHSRGSVDFTVARSLRLNPKTPLL